MGRKKLNFSRKDFKNPMHSQQDLKRKGQPLNFLKIHQKIS